jgi:predicted GNAT superfamily acetyltransferase
MQYKQYKTEASKNKDIKECKLKRASNVLIRKAEPDDAISVYDVAVSVGKARKEPYDGFLMDNYNSDPEYFINKFKENIETLEFCYIAELRGKILGFLIGYTKEEWLKLIPKWVEEINWKYNFDMEKTENFILTDKIAIMSGFTGCGIGSKMYNKYMRDLEKAGIKDIFSETLIDPTPNFASLSFRKKQAFKLAGTRYEEYQGTVYTDLIYYKPVTVKHKKHTPKKDIDAQVSSL